MTTWRRPDQVELDATSRSFTRLTPQRSSFLARTASRQGSTVVPVAHQTLVLKTRSTTSAATSDARLFSSHAQRSLRRSARASFNVSARGTRAVETDLSRRSAVPYLIRWSHDHPNVSDDQHAVDNLKINLGQKPLGDNSQTNWLMAPDTAGPALLLQLSRPIRLERLELINTGNNDSMTARGLRALAVYTTLADLPEKSGPLDQGDFDSLPWTLVGTMTLPDVRGSSVSERKALASGQATPQPVSVLLGDTEQGVAARCIKIVVESYYGRGAGLCHLALYPPSHKMSKHDAKRGHALADLQLQSIAALQALDMYLQAHIAALRASPRINYGHAFLAAILGVHEVLVQGLYILLTRPGPFDAPPDGRAWLALFKVHLNHALQMHAHARTHVSRGAGDVGDTPTAELLPTQQQPHAGSSCDPLQDQHAQGSSSQPRPQHSSQRRSRLDRPSSPSPDGMDLDDTAYRLVGLFREMLLDFIMFEAAAAPLELDGLKIGATSGLTGQAAASHANVDPVLHAGETDPMADSDAPPQATVALWESLFDASSRAAGSQARADGGFEARTPQEVFAAEDAVLAEAECSMRADHGVFASSLKLLHRHFGTDVPALVQACTQRLLTLAMPCPLNGSPEFTVAPTVGVATDSLHPLLRIFNEQVDLAQLDRLRQRCETGATQAIEACPNPSLVFRLLHTFLELLPGGLLSLDFVRLVAGTTNQTSAASLTRMALNWFHSLPAPAHNTLRVLVVTFALLVLDADGRRTALDQNLCEDVALGSERPGTADSSRSRPASTSGWRSTTPSEILTETETELAQAPPLVQNVRRLALLIGPALLPYDSIGTESGALALSAAAVQILETLLVVAVDNLQQIFADITALRSALQVVRLAADEEQSRPNTKSQQASSETPIAEHPRCARILCYLLADPDTPHPGTTDSPEALRRLLNAALHAGLRSPTEAFTLLTERLQTALVRLTSSAVWRLDVYRPSCLAADLRALMPEPMSGSFRLYTLASAGMMTQLVTRGTLTALSGERRRKSGSGQRKSALRRRSSQASLEGVTAPSVVAMESDPSGGVEAPGSRAATPDTSGTIEGELRSSMKRHGSNSGLQRQGSGSRLGRLARSLRRRGSSGRADARSVEEVDEDEEALRAMEEEWAVLIGNCWVRDLPALHCTQLMLSSVSRLFRTTLASLRTGTAGAPPSCTTRDAANAQARLATLEASLRSPFAHYSNRALQVDSYLQKLTMSAATLRRTPEVDPVATARHARRAIASAIDPYSKQRLEPFEQRLRSLHRIYGPATETSTFLHALRRAEARLSMVRHDGSRTQDLSRFQVREGTMQRRRQRPMGASSEVRLEQAQREATVGEGTPTVTSSSAQIRARRRGSYRTAVVDTAGALSTGDDDLVHASQATGTMLQERAKAVKRSMKRQQRVNNSKDLLLHGAMQSPEPHTNLSVCSEGSLGPELLTSGPLTAHGWSCNDSTSQSSGEAAIDSRDLDFPFCEPTPDDYEWDDISAALDEILPEILRLDRPANGWGSLLEDLDDTSPIPNVLWEDGAREATDSEECEGAPPLLGSASWQEARLQPASMRPLREQTKAEEDIQEWSFDDLQPSARVPTTDASEAVSTSVSAVQAHQDAAACSHPPRPPKSPAVLAGLQVPNL
ncbi:uncharacterized protein MONBRDRAFT_12423 [Monosiga brevicollis MX1]|uniref:Rho-GAP domain-containing protein n=1 Tax=Monosiga brevicollis TaxID=81824 RepID=A9VC82_MONBE|nr:uncharacterized protein MONBRDRAFT_12423 [Monosiga brevicollis MX1]EDQ84853.1 predicted protein [Monosiga brevicollis MX1]|eukprot:XP_001750354.1 hypothetical protein [Monosiga brevicollis MX1]